MRIEVQGEQRYQNKSINVKILIGLLSFVQDNTESDILAER